MSKSRLLKSVLGTAAAAAMVLSLTGVANAASALTSGQISAIVSLLQSFGADAGTVANVTSALNGQATTGTTGATTMTTSSGYTFSTNLTVGSTGADVTALQQILVAQGDLVMPAGASYGTFGALTKAAVIKYQLAKGITPAAGYVGAITRASLNTASGVSTTGGSTTTGGVTVSAPTGTSLNVSLAPTSPAASAVVAGQAAADFVEYTFTNTSATPAVVTNVTLQKTGVAADTSFDNVYLYQGATRLTDAASISSGVITFNSAAGLFTVPAGTSETIAVRVDIDASANSQLLGLALTQVQSNVVVSAAYPLAGAQLSAFTASNLASSTLTTASITPATVSVNAGTLNYSIFSAPWTITNKSVWLTRASFKVIGSIPSDALQNIGLYVSGVRVASSTGIDQNGYITFDLTSAPYSVLTGSQTLEVRADVIKGSSRLFSVSLQNASDLGVVDSNYNVGIVTGGIGSTGTITVSSGTVSVTLDPASNSGNVVAGSSNVPLAAFDFKAYGEDEKISQLTVEVNHGLANAALYANGSQIGSTQNLATNTAATFNLGSSLVIPAGTTVTVQIRADLKDVSGNNVATSSTITAIIGGVASNALGASSETSSAVPGNGNSPLQLNGPQQTIVGAGLTVAQNASISNSSAVPNTTGQDIGSFVLQANSSEGARITGLQVTLGGSINSSVYLANMYVKIAGSGINTITTTPIQPLSVGNSNNISLSPFTIPANGSVQVDVFADLGNTTGTTTVSTLAVTGYGAQSNVSLNGSTNGQTITVNAGVLGTFALETAPQSQIVAGGVSGSQIAIFDATSSVGTSYITELDFQATGSIAAITVGGVTQTVAKNSTTTVSGLNIAVPAGYVPTQIPVLVNYSTIGTAQTGGVSTNATSSVTIVAVKSTTGNTSTTTNTSVASHNMYPVAGFPVVSVITGTRTGLTAGAASTKLMDVTISANTNAVRLYTLPISVSASVLASTTGEVDVYADGSPITPSYIVASGTLTVNPGQAATTTLVFWPTNGQAGFPINTAGITHTFSIYANTVTNTTNGVGTVSFNSSLGSANLFTWQDVQGQSGAITGANLYNFPASSNNSVISN